MSNLDLWDRLKRPPPSALKAIGAGRLKGKTDINPQWRMKAITEEFGVCGIGWKYSIDKLWSEAGSNDQRMAFAQVSLYVKNDGAWSEPIQGIGGSMQVVKESSGLHTNDECYKMAVTDALSVAMKSLGVAADIYAGLWDGSKYKEPIKKAFTSPHKGTDGALENLPEDEPNYIKELALEVGSLAAFGDVAAAHKLIEDNNLGPDQKVALWSLLNSGERAALKKHAESLKGNANEL